MKKKQSISILIVACLFYSFAINAQVSIGDQPFPHSRAILDLSNSNNLGLLLPRTASNPNSAYSTDTSGLLFYYNENLFLKGADTTFNAITPWKSIFKNPEPINVFFNPTGFEGVGIGVDGWLPGDPPASNIKANLHIGLKSKDVKTTNTSASLLIGDSDSGVHMSMDNDEILVKNSANNNTGTLKLQEGGGTVQVGDPAILPYTASTNRSTLNVTGEIQQHGFPLVPVGGIIMWTGSTIPLGWGLCDGGTYPKIDGSGNILAPDLQGRFIVGVDPMDTDYAAIGINGDLGTKTTTLTEAQIPSHNHTTDPGGAHVHTIQNFSDDGLDHDAGGGGGEQYWRSNDAGSLGFSGGDHSHTISNTGGGGSHENRPPYYALAFIIKL